MFQDLAFFKECGYHRKTCGSCGADFWSLDPGRDRCGDAPCVPYSFIGAPVLQRKSVEQMREAYLSFLESQGHTRLKPYPVVAARWRDDVLLTNASIYDFQPWVTSGQVPPPANPLAISQPCIRLDDVESVGRSGRHLTSFEMMAHHAFNAPGKEVYWRDETLRLCSEFLWKAGADPAAVTYKEKWWFGGGNAGPSVEVMLGGLEVATLVFMDREAHPAGDVELGGQKYRPMERRIVDTGYGLERLAWASQGTPTVYDSVFPEVVRRIQGLAGLDIEKHRDLLGKVARLAGPMGDLRGTTLRELRKRVSKEVGLDADKLERTLEPIESAYAVVDHARTLGWMVRDGVVPSNVHVGYLARLILRRLRRLMDGLGLRLSVPEVVELHFPLGHESLKEMLEEEGKRYRETLERGRRMVEREIGKQKRVALDALVEWYDSHGLVPEVVREVAAPLGVTVEVPDDFYSRVAQRHAKRAAVAKETALPEVQAPATRRLYYEKPADLAFTAKVTAVAGQWVALDATAFYPEGGGQPADQGVLAVKGKAATVRDVQESKGVVLHRVDHPREFKAGDRVEGEVNAARRIAHTKHHTATHVVLEACRRVLGPHVWQTGAQKGIHSARLDITHFRPLDPEELRRIESVANALLMENLPVEAVFRDRNEAERAHGFGLYQGGIAPGPRIRTVTVDGNVQACGGTHCESTGVIGSVKILRAERIQDGVERLEYAAGEAALRAVQERESTLRRAADALRVPPEQLPKSVEKFFEEWKERGKALERLHAAMARAHVEEAVREAKGCVAVVKTEIDDSNMAKVAREVAGRGLLCIVARRDGRFVVATGGKTDAREVVKKMCEILGGKGGGRPEVAQGVGVNVNKLEEALKIGMGVLQKSAKK
ncbi:MAG: alanine--tRNA ligase [Halobacteria archaeon]